MQSWRRWFDEDLSSRKHRWLSPDLVSPAQYLVWLPHSNRDSSRVLVQHGLIDAHFRKALDALLWREDWDPLTSKAFLDFCLLILGAGWRT